MDDTQKMGDSNLTVGEWKELGRLTELAAADIQNRQDHPIYKALELTHAFSKSVLSHMN